MKILDLFPVKLLGEVLKDISYEEINSYKNFILNDCVHIESNDFMKNTENQSLVNLPLFLNLKNNILKYSKLYLDSLNKEYEDTQISCSWGNILLKNGKVLAHHHSNSYLSGVFYLDHGSDIVFENSSNTQYKAIELPTKPGFHINRFKVTPKPNLLLIFPSHLKHSVVPSKENHRISIAFNIIPKGKFGPPSGILNL